VANEAAWYGKGAGLGKQGIYFKRAAWLAFFPLISFFHFRRNRPSEKKKIKHRTAGRHFGSCSLSSARVTRLPKRANRVTGTLILTNTVQLVGR